ncbi:uncharacterized protein TRIADDRAFT_52765 [Trichoplax adhaerens]|uniref:Uncharacterized protein n=1 Tax=Trichoplax adhaerens TaxID=10228 RepID=B3RK97_TRIAD|nr:hypothetical protein TRIADDRAFT_52765 [Trichoplax adhaerens]EDV29163.1 hypothetical protein TRIADDRAFT_52765 [Trichoplax adhaerens]|eukprot:XP_002108365.1 hypothetical protein TRIADDRAFT_52765 [Trichoplax adhaerens]
MEHSLNDVLLALPDCVFISRLHESRHLMILVAGVAYLQCFMQCNWTGPRIASDALPRVQELNSCAQKLLSCDEEPPYPLADFYGLLWISRLLLFNCRNQLSCLKTAPIWCIRCLYAHQQLFNDTIPDLMQAIFAQIDIVTEGLLQEEDFPSLLCCQVYVEYSHLKRCYHGYFEAKKLLRKAESVIGLKLELTGRLGKRTRFQEKELAQLTASIKYETLKDNRISIEEFSKLETAALPKDVALDDDTVMHRIQFSDNQGDIPVLLPIEEIVILANGIEVLQITPDHELLKEEILAYINCNLMYPQDWSIQMMSLMIRSKIESKHHRTVERSMMQLQALVDNVNATLPPVAHRLKFANTVNFPPIWIMQLELAKILTDLGAIKSALEVYVRLEMWEEVIMCYHAIGQRDKAEQLTRERLKIQETPTLWCLLGDIRKEAEFYERAWKVSKHRNARSQRSLGFLYLYAEKYEECIACFKETLKVNSMQEHVWFSLGCAAMKTEDYHLSAEAYRQCVRLDSDKAEAWSNLSTAYIKSKQKHRAYRTLQEALKCSFENWRIWENYLFVCVDIGQFEDAITTIHRLMDLKEKYIDAEILDILVEAVITGKADSQGESAAKQKPILLKLFGRVTSKITNNAAVWYSYSKLYMQSDLKEDSDKRISLLQKSVRVASQKPKWESNLEDIKLIASYAKMLSEGALSIGMDKRDVSELVQILSSTILSLNSIVNKIKHQISYVNTEVDSQLGTICSNLEENINSLNNSIQTIRS